MHLHTKIVKNTVIQIISKIIVTTLGLVTVTIMARYLGQTGFGQYTTIITFLSFFAIIADFGLTLVTTQMISMPGTDEKKILGNLFALRLISALIFLGLACLTVIFLPYNQILKLGIIIAAFSFLFTALNQILVGLFQKKLRLDKVSIAEIISKIILVIGVILAVKFNYGLMGIIIVTVVASAVSFLLHFIFAFKFIKIQLCFDFLIWKEIIKKSWPLTITIVLNLIYLKADILILSLIKTQAEVGIYGAAYKVIDVLTIIPFTFSGIILPVLTMNWAEKNYNYFKKILQKSFDFMVILVVPLLVGTQFTAQRVMSIVAGSEFIISGFVLKILIMAVGAIFIGCIFSHAIIAIDKQKKLIPIYIFTSITALVGYLIFIPQYSYVGAAWITIYSELIIALAVIYYVWKYTDFFPNFKTMSKSLFAALIMGGVLYILSINSLLLMLSLSVIVYFSLLYLLGACNFRFMIQIFKD